MSFRADANVAETVSQLARQCVALAKNKFEQQLDFGLDSLKLVDQQLQQFHEMVRLERPTQDELAGFSQLYGAYLGEVIRLAHGGEWGLCELADHSQETA